MSAEFITFLILLFTVPTALAIWIAVLQGRTNNDPHIENNWMPASRLARHRHDRQ